MEIHLTIPRQWNELSTIQAENVCHALHCSTTAQENQEEVKTAAFIIVAKELLRHNSFKAIRTALKEFTLNVYTDIAKFVFEEKVLLTKFPETLPTIKPLYGPAEKLRNISMAELSYADALYFRWQSTKNHAYLNNLVATLYRPKAENPTVLDARMLFNKAIADMHADMVSELPLKTRLMIAFAFEGSRNFIASQFPYVFPSSKPVEGVEPTPKKYVPFGELIAAKVKYDPSKIDIVENMNAYKFLSVYETELREMAKPQNRRNNANPQGPRRLS